MSSLQAIGHETAPRRPLSGFHGPRRRQQPMQGLHVRLLRHRELTQRLGQTWRAPVAARELRPRRLLQPEVERRERARDATSVAKQARPASAIQSLTAVAAVNACSIAVATRDQPARMHELHIFDIPQGIGPETALRRLASSSPNLLMLQRIRLPPICRTFRNLYLPVNQLLAAQYLLWDLTGYDRACSSSDLPMRI